MYAIFENVVGLRQTLQENICFLLDIKALFRFEEEKPMNDQASLGTFSSSLN